MDLFHQYTSTLRTSLDKKNRAFEAALKEELDQRELAHSSECESLRSKLEAFRQRVSHLEQENASLRAKIERAAKRKPLAQRDDNVLLRSSGSSTAEGWGKSGHSSVTSTPEPCVKSGQVSEGVQCSLENSGDGGQEGEDLRGLLKAKEREYAVLMGTHVKALARVRKYKESCGGWQDWYERSVARSQALKESGNTLGQSKPDLALMPTPSPLVPMSPELPIFSDQTGNTKFRPPNHETNVQFRFTNPADPGDGRVTVHPVDGKESNDENNPETESSVPSTQPPSSPPPGTEIDLAQKMDAYQPTLNSDSDSPVVVYERSLKRKRTEKASKASPVTGLGDSEQRVTKRPMTGPAVKGEPCSSPTMLATAQRKEMVHDSIDLDEVGNKSFTPTKGKRTYDINHSQVGVSLSPHLGTSRPRDIRVKGGGRRYGLIDQQTYDHYLNLSKAPNLQTLEMTSDHDLYARNTSTKRRRGSGSDQIPLLAEDGDTFLSGRDLGDNATKRGMRLVSNGVISPTMRTDYYNRLDSLLSGNSPDKRKLSTSDIPSPAPDVNRITSDKNSKPASGANTELKLATARKGTHSPSPANGNFQPQLKASVRIHSPGRQGVNPGSVVIQRKERLRDRPLQSLRLDDFKIDPRTNDGVDYAFHEVIRGRDRRSCMENCTKPECYGGKIKKVLEIGGMPAAPGRGLWESCSGGDRDEGELQILQNHTRLDARAIGGLRKEEKEDLILRANTYRFAKEYGKHKGSPARPPTPPGFWRTEMPTTQQAAADKEQAAERERVELERRYKEAMRGGGRWIFRDE